MRNSHVAHVCVGVVLLLGAPRPVAAQTPDAQALRQEIDQLKQQFQSLQKEYGDRLTALETKLSAIDARSAASASSGANPGAAPAPSPSEAQTPAASQTAQVPPGAEGAGGPSGALPVYGAGASASKVFNPDMAVIGDFLGAGGRNTVNPSPAMEMHESEASFQAVVDPYARADFFLSFGEEGVNLEEGYLTFPAIPGGLLVKVGKQRAAFGKVNTLHNHVLPWTDRPLVSTSLVGGEDGINDAGFSVTRSFAGPKQLFLEGTAQLFRGDSADVFQSNRKSDVSVVGHFRGYKDLNESTNLDVGVSYARGHNNNAAGISSRVLPAPAPDAFLTNLYGVDATLRWKPLRRAIYHSFVGRSEFIWSDREGLPQQVALRDPLLRTQRAFGYYASGDYQLARRWFAGVRYDHSDSARNAAQTDKGGSFVLTYWPTEVSQLRAQYRMTNYAEGINANELRFQVQFSLGAHGAHPF